MVQSLKSPGDIEAAYRFTRNPAIKAQMIAEAEFKATAEKLKAYTCLLALEDTTTLKFNHDTVCDEMGHTTSQKNSRGMHAYSVLLFAPKEQYVVGLIEQELWTRDVNSYGKSSQRATRPYKEKESFKWERASQTMGSRLGNDMQKIISVCDREADLIEYLTYTRVSQLSGNKCFQLSGYSLFKLPIFADIV